MGPSTACSYKNVQHGKHISVPTHELLMMSVSLLFCFHSSTQDEFPVGV